MPLHGSPGADAPELGKRVVKLQRQTRLARRMIRHGRFRAFQSHSACSCPKAPAPRRGKRSRSLACRAITSRSAIPRHTAWRGFRDSSGNFIVVRRCATIPPGFSLSSSDCCPQGISTCCCRPMSRDFCSRGCKSSSRAASGSALPGFESYRMAHSKAGFSRLLMQLGLPQPATRNRNVGAAQLRDSDPLSRRWSRRRVGTASRGIWFVRNANDLEGALQDLDRQRAPLRAKCWCRN